MLQREFWILELPLLLVLLLAACAPSSEAPDPASPPQGRLYLRLAAGTPLHEAPDARAGVIAQIEQDLATAVEEERPPWFRIDLGDSTGWVQVEDESRRFRVTSAPPGPRPEVAAPRALVGRARSLMTAPLREGSCGPYGLLTDVEDAALLAACERLGGAVEAAYGQRIGLTPVGEAAASILLFDSPQAFRQFSAAAPGSPKAGYAAHAGRGYVALYADADDRDRVLETLVHELAHLLTRRAIGGELPRWLSEGLADALGDSAGEAGLEPLVGVRGAEAEAARLLGAYSTDRAAAIGRLVALPAEAFDAEVVSYDYEQSALLVRFLLLDGDLGPRFRAYLGELRRGRRYDAGDLEAALGRSWAKLDVSFQSWLTRSAGSVG